MADSTSKTKQAVLRRLDELARLERTWVRLRSTVDWLRGLLARLMDAGVPAPCLSASSTGDVIAEWRVGSWHMAVVFLHSLHQPKAMYSAVHQETCRAREETVSLSAPEAEARLAMLVKRHLPVGKLLRLSSEKACEVGTCHLPPTRDSLLCEWHLLRWLESDECDAYHQGERPGPETLAQGRFARAQEARDAEGCWVRFSPPSAESTSPHRPEACPLKLALATRCTADNPAYAQVLLERAGKGVPQ